MVITSRIKDHNGKPPYHHWDAYIEAMRGPLSSKPLDPHKLDAHYARERAEARFFRGRNKSSVNRSAFHLTKMLKRQTG